MRVQVPFVVRSKIAMSAFEAWWFLTFGFLVPVQVRFMRVGLTTIAAFELFHEIRQPLSAFK